MSVSNKVQTTRYNVYKSLEAVFTLEVETQNVAQHLINRMSGVTSVYLTNQDTV